MLASAVLQRVRDTLQDPTGARWPDPELLRYLSDGQSEVVIHKPDAKSATEVMELAPGTRQQIPAGSLRLLDVIRNMGEDGETPGDAITLAGRGVLDSRRRGWHADQPGRQVDHYVMDLRAPETFYVYPAAPGFHIEVLLAKTPADVTSVSQLISLDRIYVGALVNYVLFRAYAKDADFAANLERAALHAQAFAAALGAKTQSGFVFSPRSPTRDTRGAASSSPLV
jgi:hypothetical protein